VIVLKYNRSFSENLRKQILKFEIKTDV